MSDASKDNPSGYYGMNASANEGAQDRKQWSGLEDSKLPFIF